MTKGITPEKAREELIEIIGEDLFPKFEEKFIMTDKKPNAKDVYDFMVKNNAYTEEEKKKYYKDE